VEFDPKTYWKRPDGYSSPREFWVDPDPTKVGLLDSQDIRFYVNRVRLIWPFVESRLGPASYELTLGPLFQYKGERGLLTAEEPELVIPPNSIVFVSFNEVLCLPHYIAARFGLTVGTLYHGALLGAGPQVDPGYQGALSCPLHNISNRQVAVERGDSIARVDFIKTTFGDRRIAKRVRRIRDEEELYRMADGADWAPLFNRDRRWRQPIFGYAAAREKVESSVAGLADRLEDMNSRVTSGEATVRRFSQFGSFAALAVAVGVIACIVGLIQLGTRYVDNSVGRVTERIDKLEQAKMQPRAVRPTVSRK
jgi:deoxycytidine triphosphate deaminase